MQVSKIIRNFIEKLISDPGETDADVYLEDAIAFSTGQLPPQKKTEEEKESLPLKSAFGIASEASHLVGITFTKAKRC